MIRQDPPREVDHARAAGLFAMVEGLLTVADVVLPHEQVRLAVMLVLAPQEDGELVGRANYLCRTTTDDHPLWNPHIFVAEYEEAAETLGASPWQSFRRVILPEVGPALLAGTALSFTRSLGEFGAVIFIAGNIAWKTEVTSPMTNYSGSRRP